MSHYLGAKKKFNPINKLFLSVLSQRRVIGEYSSNLVVNAWLGGCSAPIMEIEAAQSHRPLWVGLLALRRHGFDWSRRAAFGRSLPVTKDSSRPILLKKSVHPNSLVIDWLKRLFCTLLREI